jgi:hypothetical protein
MVKPDKLEPTTGYHVPGVHVILREDGTIAFRGSIILPEMYGPHAGYLANPP